jgi:hypothetical protein
MSRLEDLRPNAALTGVHPDAQVTVVTALGLGSEALELIYKTAARKVAIAEIRKRTVERMNKTEAAAKARLANDIGNVEFQDENEHRVHYVRRPFQREPDFGVTSVNYNLAELLARAGEPS